MAKKSNKSIRAEVAAKRKVAAKDKAKDTAERRAGVRKQIKATKKPKK